jgi:glycosyltransferase involved in cell wall biosynthesis
MNMAKLSVVTIALNEEHNIVQCLESVRWADELIVVDSGSLDLTVERAKQFPAKVMQMDWRGYGATKNEALQHATGDWILWLDADERVTSELAKEIQEILKNDNGKVAGYTVPRKAYFLGKWIKHCGWYPSRVTRLFRRTRGKFSETKVHEHLMLDGVVGKLQHDLLHYTDPNLHHYFQKFNRYTSLAAEDLHADHRAFAVSDLFLRPPFVFFKMYFLRLGFLDGLHGFILSIVSMAYVFVKYAKLWELQKGTNVKE